MSCGREPEEPRDRRDPGDQDDGHDPSARIRVCRPSPVSPLPFGVGRRVATRRLVVTSGPPTPRRAHPRVLVLLQEPAEQRPRSRERRGDSGRRRSASVSTTGAEDDEGTSARPSIARTAFANAAAWADRSGPRSASKAHARRMGRARSTPSGRRGAPPRAPAGAMIRWTRWPPCREGRRRASPISAGQSTSFTVTLELGLERARHEASPCR